MKPRARPTGEAGCENGCFVGTNGTRGGPPPKRRWTLAMTVTDGGISDEVLVKELERGKGKQYVRVRAG